MSCLNLLLPIDGDRDTACVRCEQVEDLISLLAELKEEVEKLRAIRECEQELDWWSHSLPRLKERCRGNTPQIAMDPPTCHGQAERRDLRDGEEWKQVHAQHCRWAPSILSFPPKVPLHNRFEALELEGQGSKGM